MPLRRPSTTWRDWYNPLKGLTVSRIVAMEDAADRGQHADLQWFWHHPPSRGRFGATGMERTDVTVQAAIARRLSFIDSIEPASRRRYAGARWEIRAVENADPTLAAEQADLLKYAYNRIANFHPPSHGRYGGPAGRQRTAETP